MSRAYRVRPSPTGALSEESYIGCDPLDAICAWLQDNGLLRGIIAEYEEWWNAQPESHRPVVTS